MNAEEQELVQKLMDACQNLIDRHTRILELMDALAKGANAIAELRKPRWLRW